MTIYQSFSAAMPPRLWASMDRARFRGQLHAFASTIEGSLRLLPDEGVYFVLSNDSRLNGSRPRDGDLCGYRFSYIVYCRFEQGLRGWRRFVNSFPLYNPLFSLPLTLCPKEKIV